MNRDYIKLESQEIYALVTRVMNEWTPDIHSDRHHGGSAPYTLTWQGTLNPAADATLRAYPYAEIFPRIRGGLRADGYDGFDYAGAQTRDGVRGWGSTSVEARKHHVYTGLVNSTGILFETPSSSRRVRNGAAEAIPQDERYFHQVRGQVIGVTAVLRHAAEKRAEIRALTNASHSCSAGRRQPDGRQRRGRRVLARVAGNGAGLKRINPCANRMGPSTRKIN